MKRVADAMPFFIIILSSILFTGCFGVDRNFSSLKNEILSSTDGNYYKDIEFSIGPVGLSLAGAIVKLSDDEENAQEILEHISHVQVGVYKNEYGSGNVGSFQLLQTIDSQMKTNGWQYIVRSYNKGDVTGVYIKYSGENRLNEMFVVSLNRKELTLVEVKGELEKVIETAIREKGMNIHYAVADN